VSGVVTIVAVIANQEVVFKSVIFTVFSKNSPFFNKNFLFLTPCEPYFCEKGKFCFFVGVYQE
jgi:hypothetical protein